jgi:hypothetical protein
MKINIIKSKIPIIWLDTSNIIKLTRLKNGIQLSSLEQKRCEKLYDIIYRKVHQRKLLCPTGDQFEEIEIGNGLVEECRELQSDLALGIRFMPRSHIKEIQMQQEMKAYINGDKEIAVSYKDVFYRDPVEALMEIKDFSISIDFPSTREEIDNSIKEKKQTNEQIETLRQDRVSKGITYEQQLEQELIGQLQAMDQAQKQFGNKIMTGAVPALKDFLQLEIIWMKPLQFWKECSGDQENLEEFVKFFNSNFWQSMPKIDISSKLWAKITTSTTKVKSGDSMDIEQLASVIPYCNFVITDRKMKGRITNFEIDKTYHTKFSV